MNSPVEGNGITSPQAAQQLLQQVNFNGMTPLGSALDAKVRPDQAALCCSMPLSNA